MPTYKDREWGESVLKIHSATDVLLWVFYSKSLMILFSDHWGTSPIGQDKFTEKCCYLHPPGQQV